MSAVGISKVILVGFLGADPKTRTTNNGTPVSNFSVAVNEAWKDGDGKKVEKEKVTWFQVVAFGALGEICGQFLTKGRHVYIEGRLQNRAWEDESGEQRTAVEVIANEMRLLDSMKEEKAAGNGKAANGSREARRR
jgi:single-strand DNA-binding protein